MQPDQEQYRAKMRQRGWIDEAGNIAWPQDKEGRQKMARALMGIELVSCVDSWLIVAQDEIDDTYQAPGASPDRNKKVWPEAKRRREVFRTLNSEQRDAVRELLRYVAKGQFFSFCVSLDQALGGSTISLDNLSDMPGERLEIHSSDQDELKIEQGKWLENFSIIFGRDDRYEGEA